MGCFVAQFMFSIHSISFSRFYPFRCENKKKNRFSLHNNCCSTFNCEFIPFSCSALFCCVELLSLVQTDAFAPLSPLALWRSFEYFYSKNLFISTISYSTILRIQPKRNLEWCVGCASKRTNKWMNEWLSPLTGSKVFKWRFYWRK